MILAETQILILLLIAALVGMGARRFKLPYTVALVVAGVALGFLHFEELGALHLTPELLMMVFLPALLFEAAYHLEFSQFRKLAPAVLILAVPGVLLATTVTALLSYWGLSTLGFTEYTLGHAFLFGAMIAATDPISVLALFKTLGVTKRLYLLVEGESLLNDGVAVVVFIIVGAVLGISSAHGHAPHLSTATEIAVYGIKTFAWMGIGGTLIGAGVGAVASLLTRQIDDKLIETSITVVVAYGSFLLAEHFAASGVLATVAAGVVLGSFGAKFGMSARTRVAVIDFWEFLAFFSNTFVFLLVGLELDVPELLGVSGAIAVGAVAVLVARAVAVYSALPLTRLVRMEPIPWIWGHVLVWGGLRGSLSMVLVIGLPAEFPGRRLLLLMVFGVVSLSLVGQALTMKPLLQKLGLIGGNQVRVAYEQARARVLMARAALRELEHHVDAMEPPVRATLLERYTRQLEEGRVAVLAAAGAQLDQELLDEATLHLLQVEIDALLHAQSEGIVGAEAAEALLVALADERASRMAHGVVEG
jgi:monovalent cation:H+ antiporter, CPA1 family